MLPQFVPIDQTEFDERDTQKSRKRMNKLRKLINESLWTGTTTPKSDLVSLKDIIVKQPQQDGSHSSIEQYVCLANSFKTEGHEASQDTDKTVIVSRM